MLDINKYKLHTTAVLAPLVNAFFEIPLTPMDTLPKFAGAGVYALYLSDTVGTVYDGFVIHNIPIYVGKAVPKGWRQGKEPKKMTNKLQARINEHKRGINLVGLGSQRFLVKFAIMEGTGLDLISALESALIRQYKPLWNSYIDGFGNHDPGSGRYGQAPSEWDTLHPGRHWATRLTGQVPCIEDIIKKIESY